MSLNDLLDADSPPPSSPLSREKQEALFLDGSSTPSRTPLKRRHHHLEDESLSSGEDEGHLKPESALDRLRKTLREGDTIPPNVERILAGIFDYESSEDEDEDEDYREFQEALAVARQNYEEGQRFAPNPERILARLFPFASLSPSEDEDYLELEEAEARARKNQREAEGLEDLFEDESLSPSEDEDYLELKGALDRARQNQSEAARLADPNVEGIAPHALANLFDDESLSPSEDEDLVELKGALARARQNQREVALENQREAARLADPNVEGVAPRALAELFDDPFAAQDPLALGGSTEEEPKRPRVMAKVDAERLLAPKGLPALVGAARRFKAKGKGHETSDLRRLMDTYQMWAHGMFPKGEFAYTVERVEKVCRTTQMVNAIKGLRDEFHPPPRSPTPDPEDADGERALGSPGTLGQGGQESLGAFIERDEESLGDETFRYAPGAETLAADRRPLFAPGPDVDEDEDELAALAEMERETEPGESTAAETRREAQVDFGGEPPQFDEEEEW